MRGKLLMNSFHPGDVSLSRIRKMAALKVTIKNFAGKITAMQPPFIAGVRCDALWEWLPVQSMVS
ncbi:MAG: hypothetical protein ACOX8I_08965 [Bacillota bacterium]|jgi:hypothetical protein